MLSLVRRRTLCTLGARYTPVVPNYIDGKLVPSAADAFVPVLSPASQQELRRLYEKVDGAPTSPAGFDDLDNPPESSRKRAR